MMHLVRLAYVLEDRMLKFELYTVPWHSHLEDDGDSLKVNLNLNFFIPTTISHD